MTKELSVLHSECTFSHFVTFRFEIHCFGECWTALSHCSRGLEFVQLWVDTHLLIFFTWLHSWFLVNTFEFLFWTCFQAVVIVFLSQSWNNFCFQYCCVTVTKVSSYPGRPITSRQKYWFIIFHGSVTNREVEENWQLIIFHQSSQDHRFNFEK